MPSIASDRFVPICPHSSELSKVIHRNEVRSSRAPVDKQIWGIPSLFSNIQSGSEKLFIYKQLFFQVSVFGVVPLANLFKLNKMTFAQNTNLELLEVVEMMSPYLTREMEKNDARYSEVLEEQVSRQGLRELRELTAESRRLTILQMKLEDIRKQLQAMTKTV